MVSLVITFRHAALPLNLGRLHMHANLNSPPVEVAYSGNQDLSDCCPALQGRGHGEALTS